MFSINLVLIFVIVNRNCWINSNKCHLLLYKFFVLNKKHTANFMHKILLKMYLLCVGVYVHVFNTF